MATPAFDAAGIVRPALLTIGLNLSFILLLWVTIIIPAHASGTVNPTVTYWGGGNNTGFNCNGMASVSALHECEKAKREKWLADDHDWFVSRGAGNIVSCPAPVLNDYGPTGNYVDHFSVTYYRIAYNCGYGYYCNYLTFCQLQPVVNYYIFTKPACPDNSTGSTTCTCNDPYVPDAAGTSCVPAAVCPVDKLTTPPFDDECSTSLEQGKGVDVNHACGTLRDPDMVKAASCIADKIHALNIPYTQPSATIRTTSYQNHLLGIWNNSQRLGVIMNSVVYRPEIKQACALTYADVNNEKTTHGITHQPSSSGDAAPHVEHRAIDIPEAVAKALMKQVTIYSITYKIVNGQNVPTKTIASDVEDYMHSATVNPPACDSNIRWGGRFNPKDPVHYQLP